MNHIYKSIFNKALGVFTAVPEFASAHGKGSERTVVGRVAKGTAGFAASALAISIGLALSSNAMANVDTDVASGVLRIADPTGTNSIRMGSGTTLDDANKQWNSISIGTDAGVNTASSVAIGYGAKAGKPDKFLGQGAVALGYNAQALGTSGIAIGEDSSTTNGHNGIAIGAYSKTENEKSISIGAFSTASGAQSIVMSSNYDTNSRGPVSVASGRRSQIYGSETTVSGEQSVSIGDTNTIASARTYALGNNINVAAGADDSLVFGTRANVGGESSIAIGKSAKATKNWASAIGTDAIASGGSGSQAYGYDSVASGKSAIAQGFHSHADGQSAIAIGDNAKAGGIATVSVGYMANGQSADVDKANTPSTNKATYGTAVGHFAGADYVGTDNLRSTALGNQAGRYGEGGSINTAVGNLAGMYVKGSQNVAVGNLAGSGDATNKLEANNTVSIGTASKASANNAAAMGTQAAASGSNSAAIGLNSKATTDSSIAIGTSSEAGGPATSAALLGTKAVAIGYETKALGTSNVALGYGSVAENGHDSIAIGIKTKTSNVKSIAIGAYSEASGAQSTVISNNYGSATAVSTASGTRSQVYGAETNVSGNNSVAIGDTNNIESARTYALGNNINAAAGTNDSLAFGTKANVGGVSSIAMGNTAQATSNYATAIGGDALAHGSDGALAVGRKATANADSGAMAIGYDAIATGKSGIAQGYHAHTNAQSGLAIGDNAKASGIGQVAIGYASNAQKADIDKDATAATNKADYSVTVGHYAGADYTGTNNIRSTLVGDSAGRYGEEGNQNTAIGSLAGMYVKGSNNVALGIGAGSGAAAAKLEASETVAIGHDSRAFSDYSTAIGSKAKARGVNSIAMGSTANSSAENAIAVGNGAAAANANSVALGAGSATSAAHTTGPYTLNGSYTAAGQPVAANGTVSVGSAGKERQIQNVAAGVISATSTDAINGSQLYATNNYLSNLAGSVKNVLGGDAAVDNAGNVTMSNIGGTGKGNVNDAIAAANTKVAAGNNITVTPTTNADGSKTYTVATTKDLVVDSVKAGDTTVNKDGVTIAGGPSVKKDGINAGNKKITGVADGNVAAGSTDAVNGGQLAAVKAKADSAVQDIKSGDEKALSVTKAGNTYTITPNLSGDLVDANGNITAPTTPADKGKLVTAGTVADALANTHFVVDTKATDGELDAASQADQKIKASNKVTLQAGKNLKAKQTNGANGAEVEFSLKDSISLKEVKVGEGSANEVVLNNNGVNVAGNTYINKDGLNANGNKVANVKAGDVSATSTDAVNGAQLHNVATSVANVLGGNAAVDGNGNVTSSDIGGTGKGTVHDAIAAVNATAAKHTTVVEGKNVKVTKGKNAAGGDEYTVATKDDLDVTSVTAGNTTVNTNGLTITGGPSVTRGGIDAGNRVISGVKAGDVSATSQEAVNGSQLHATNTKLDGVKAKADTAVQDVKSGDENALTAVKDPNTNIVTVTPKLSGDLVDANGNITAPTTPADKGKLVTAGTVADALANTHFVVDTKATDGELDAASQADQKIKAGNKVTLQAGKNLKAKQTNGANGAQVEFSLKDSISLKEVTAGEGANQVVLNDKGVNVGGNTYINNDGLNANGNKITNVADGVDPTDAVNKGQLDAVKGVADSAVKSVNVANGEQNLVVDNSDPKNPKLSLKKDLTVDSVKAGDSTLNNDGLTIAGGPSVKKDGINAGDKTITNVAPGAVTPTSKDAVNGGQLYNVANNVKDLIGPDAAIDPATGKVTVADPAKGIGETGKGNIGDAIKHVNDAAKAAADTAKKHTTVEQGDNIVVEESLNADGGKHYKVSTAKDLNVDSVKAGDTTVNNDGVTIAGGPSVTKAGINAGGNTITNVADGVNPNDAVNKGQLDAVKGVADSAVKSVDVANGEQNLVVDNSDPKNPKLSLKKDLTVDSVKAGDSTLNNDGLTIAGGPSVKKDGIDAADKKITNVAAGDVAENSKDAVNGGQLHNVAKGVADVLGGDAAVDGNGKVTMTNIGETGKGNVNDAIKHVNDAVKAAADTAKKHTTVEQGDNIVVEESTNADGGKHYKVSTARDLNVDSVKAGDTTVNNDGVTIAGGPSVTKGGINAGGNTITNVADGVNDTDAVNKGQLNKVDTKVSNVAQNVVNVLGGDAAVNGNGDITMTNIGETGKGNINDAIKSVNDLAKKAAAEKTSVKAKEGRSNVTVTEGVNAAGGHEYTVDVERSVTNAGSDYVTVTNNHDADSNTTTYTVDVSAKTKASLAKADSAVQGLTSKDGNLNFTKGANGNVEVSFNDNLNVKNVTTDRVQVANGPSMSKDGINAAGKAISNVANGNVAADSKDAVNGGQLHETAKSVADVIGGGATVKDGKVVAGQNGIGNTGQNTVHGAIAAINQNTANNFNQIRGDLRKMDRDLRGGIAGALATAGLPQAFRPGKSMVAAAASTYRGQSGLAIGVSRISDNGKVILKVTGNTNSRGDFGGTIGAGYQW